MDAVASALLDTTVVVDHLRGKAPSIADRFKETHNLYMPDGVGRASLWSLSVRFQGKSAKAN